MRLYDEENCRLIKVTDLFIEKDPHSKSAFLKGYSEKEQSDIVIEKYYDIYQAKEAFRRIMSVYVWNSRLDDPEFIIELPSAQAMFDVANESMTGCLVQIIEPPRDEEYLENSIS